MGTNTFNLSFINLVATLAHTIDPHQDDYGLCLLSCVANCYILASIPWIKQRSLSPNLYFTLSLSAADAWVGLAMAIGLIFQSYLPFVAKFRLSNPYCFGLAYEAVRMGAMVTSVLHLLALAVNHYYGILRPLHYQSTVTPELTSVFIALLWLIPPAGFLIYFSVIPGQAFLSEQCSGLGFFTSFNFRITVFVIIFIPLLSMFLIYTHIFILIQRRKNNPVFSASTRLSRQESVHWSKNVKAVVTTSLILGTFVVGWMPSVLLFTMMCKDGCMLEVEVLAVSRPALLLILSMLANSLIILKSLCDAIIYAARVRELKSAINRMHASCCFRGANEPDRHGMRETGWFSSLRVPRRFSGSSTAGRGSLLSQQNYHHNKLSANGASPPAIGRHASMPTSRRSSYTQQNNNCQVEMFNTAWRTKSKDPSLENCPSKSKNCNRKIPKNIPQPPPIFGPNQKKSSLHIPQHSTIAEEDSNLDDSELIPNYNQKMGRSYSDTTYCSSSIAHVISKVKPNLETGKNHGKNTIATPREQIEAKPLFVTLVDKKSSCAEKNSPIVMV